jgi:hypothetical protein
LITTRPPKRGRSSTLQRPMLRPRQRKLQSAPNLSRGS